MQVSIRIKGHLDPSWQEWLKGLQIEKEGSSNAQVIHRICTG